MSEANEDAFKAGDVVVDLNRRIITKAGVVVSLTRTEWLLLAALLYNEGSIVPANVLLSRVWGPELRDNLTYLRVWVSRVRAKLESDLTQPRIIGQDSYGYGFYADR